MVGPKLSNFKIGGPILQKSENKGTKTAIKLNNNNNFLSQGINDILYFLYFKFQSHLNLCN